MEMEIQTMTDEQNTNEYQTLGKYLKSVRENKNMQLQAIAKKTRINVKVLHALEEELHNELPSKTYLKGFVKSYAKEIEADVDKAMRLLDESYEIKEVAPHEQIENSILNQDLNKLDSIGKGNSSEMAKKLVIAILVLGTIAALLYGIYYLFSKASEKMHEEIVNEIPTHEKIESPAKNVAVVENAQADEQMAVTVEAAIENEDTNEVAKQVTEEKQEVVAKKVEEKKEVVKKEVKSEESKKQEDEEEIVFTKIQGPLYKLIDNDPKLNDSNIFPSYIKGSFLQEKENVFVNAVYNDTWLTYKNTDQDIKSFILKKGKTLLIRGDEVRLFLGNLSAVEVIYNGKLVKAESDSGVKSLIFPESSIKKFSLPLFVYDKKLGKFFTEDEYKNKNQ